MHLLFNHKYFRASIWLLLLFLLIYMGEKVAYIFIPLVVLLETLFFPMLIAGILYYLTCPFVDWLHHKKIPRTAGVILLYLAALGVLVLFSITITPTIQSEIASLQEDIPLMMQELEQILLQLEERGLLPHLDPQELDVENLARDIAGAFGQYSSQIVESIGAVLDFFTLLFATIIIVPFLLFFLLKEKGSPIISKLLPRLVPENHLPQVNSALAELNRAMGSYVQGIGIVCLSVGILVYLGYNLIGLEYSLILAAFATITNIIPFLGPFIGAIPAVIIGMLHSPAMMLKVIAVIVVAQQLESLLISPQVMGRKLAMNPLTIIILVMVAGRLGGFLAIILAVPAFTILKIIITHVYQFLEYQKEA